MQTDVAEAQPIKTLKELYDNLDKLRPWPPIAELRESTEYVYRGTDLIVQKLQLEKVDRDEQPRTLVCHDMKGGYLEDRFIDGSKSHDSYIFYHWSVIDTFVYFSHYFVTIPPYGWINAAHNHGVKILGTVITEAKGIWDPILETQESVRKFADALIDVAKFYKFDGWLLNVENEIKPEEVENLLYFVKYLTERIHEEVRGSEIIWYDSVTDDGQLKWQNELNEKNKDFFLNCDGIYLNYNWSEFRLERSYNLAKIHERDVRDVYVGLDVWGRGCPGGGGFNSAYALEKIRQQGLSVAVFAPGWTHEFFGPQTFHLLENLFWAQLFPYLYVHVPIYDGEVFRTSFCRGNGVSYYRCGEVQLEMSVVGGQSKFEERSFYNLTMQKPQISVPIPHLKFTQSAQPVRQKEENSKSDSPKKPVECVYETRRNIIRICGNVVNVETKLSAPEVNSFEFCDRFSYEGGGCLKLITKDFRLYHRLFLVHLEFQQDVQATVIYEETEAATNGARNEPILMLGNDAGLKSILQHRSERLNSRWRKCVYLTNVRTVNEIGVSFARESVCYLGEIILEQKHQRHSDRSDSADCVNRSTDSVY